MTMHEATLMTKMRKLRQRKAGSRGSTGRLRPPKVDEIMAVALTQPHRRDLPVETDKRGRIVTDLRRDQRAESPLGRMRLANLISEAQYQAGVEYRRQHVLYLSVIQPPQSLARFSPGPARVVADEKQRRWVADYEAAFKSMDHRAQHPVGQVVLRDQPVHSWQVAEVRRGLIQLCGHYGMGD